MARTPREVGRIPELRVTRSELAEILGYSPASISNLLGRATIRRPAADGTWMLREVVSDFAKAAKRRGPSLSTAEEDAGGQPGGSESEAQAKARRAIAQADLEEIEVGKALGTLLPRDATRAAVAGAMLILRARLLGLPGKLAPQLVGLPAQSGYGILHSAIHEALAELAEGLARASLGNRPDVPGESGVLPAPAADDHGEPVGASVPVPVAGSERGAGPLEE